MKVLGNMLGFLILVAAVSFGAWGGCALGARTYTGPMISWVSPLDAAVLNALRGAYLRGAFLRQAHLCDANLSEADLSGADLCDADLSGADLRNADLSRADLMLLDSAARF